jgi:hypothetical protein
MSLTKLTPPQLKHDNWPAWLTKFKNHVGKKLFSYLEKAKPAIDGTLWLSLVDADGEETIESITYTKLIRKKEKKWKMQKDKLHQHLMNACSDNPSAFTVAQLHEDDDPSALFAALETRFRDQSNTALLHHVSIFNQLSCGSSETRTEFIERLTAYILTLTNLGYAVTPEVRMERLLNGLKGREKFESDARQFQLIENKSWDTITNQLRAWDREEELLSKNKVSANIATTSNFVVRCFRCKQTGHKRFECPMNSKPKNFNQNKQQNKSKNWKHQGQKQKGNNNGYQNRKPGSNTNRKPLTCAICGIIGHHFNNCRHAEKFRNEFQKKRKAQHQATPDDFSSDGNESS